MKQMYKDYLFSKNVLVREGKEDVSLEENFAALYAIANKYNIRVRKGDRLATLEVLKYLESQIPGKVTLPFYRGFPESVKKLSPTELLFDQLFHYWQTYGQDNFEGDAGHSLFEENFTRTAFKEATTIKEFVIVDEAEAYKMICSYVDDLCTSTRPLSEGAYSLVKDVISNGYVVKSIDSRDTAIKLLLDLNDSKLARYINLSDILKVVEEILHNKYPKMKLKKLNLKNQDRKFIASLLDNAVYTDFQKMLCFEKRADWKGLLHHIHYAPKSKKMKVFVDEIRNSEKNLSAMSNFERCMAFNVGEAARVLRATKGSGAILRNLNYMLSRCKSKKEVAEVVSYIDSESPVLLLQLIAQYANYAEDGGNRTFTFTKNYKLKTHRETADEVKSRRSFVTKPTRDLLVDALWAQLKNVYKNKLGKVYIDEKMKDIAVPMQETTSEIGYGILPKGTRIHIPEGKVVRAFTYWEKVNDIDLSAMGVTSDGKQIEFSWRYMYDRQSDAVAFSGDITNGFRGGSEYFDFDLDAIRKKYPTMKYIVVCNNVYSGIAFNKCTCRAGYMLRSKIRSGEIWEPRTVESSFSVTGDSTYSYMFAIDMERNDFVWLNMCKDSMARVAGDSDFTFLAKYINMTQIINVYSLFEMMATEIVQNPEEADVIVSDEILELDESQEQVRSTDTEKLLRYLNNK